jgi:hypothetical protein
MEEVNGNCRKLHNEDFIIYNVHQYYQGDQIKANVMGRSCSANGRCEKCIQNYSWKVLKKETT